MSFSEFCHSAGMRIILFLLSFAALLFHHFLAVSIINSLYGKQLQLKKMLLYMSVIFTVLYAGTAFCFFAFTGYRPFHQLEDVLLLNPSPIAVIVQYLIGCRMAALPKRWLVNIIREAYLYFLIINPLSSLILRFFRSLSSPENYFTQAIGVLTFMAVGFFLFRACLFIIKRTGICIIMPNNMPLKKRYFLPASLFVCVISYLLVIYMQFYHDTAVGDFMIAVCLIIILLCDILFANKSSLKHEITNKNIQIVNLMQTVDSYLQLNNDFNEILENYGKHLTNNDLEAITRYHESMMGKTMLTAQSVKIVSQLEENPPLVSMLLKKILYARQMKVNLTMSSLASIEDMYIDDFDLSRLLNNLLDNAIEAACCSQDRCVSFSIKEKTAYSKVIIISNSISSNVDIDAIMKGNFTTKKSHMGIGLTQVQNIAGKYGNLAVNFSCRDYMFFVHIQMWQPRCI